MSKISKDKNGIYIGPRSTAPGAIFHEKRNKPALLRGLAQDYRQQSYWETPYYFSFLDKCIEGIDLADKVCMDVGCGDGRFTEYLIKKGASEVVCVDADYEALRNLSRYSEEKGFRDSLTLINSDVECIPVPTESVDVAVAVGVFYYLGNHYERGIKSVYSKLKKSGTLISSEPNLEGLALRSLLFNPFTDMLTNFQRGTFNETSGDTVATFPIFLPSKIESFYENAGFTQRHKHAISIFHPHGIWRGP